MRFMLLLALRSAWNRRFSLGLTLLAIALSVSLLLGIERLRHEVRTSFSQSVSGTDLVVGARSSSIQLMLYAVFRMGEATNNISWQSVEYLAEHPAVAWTIPLSLGDSHRGFPVLGTTPDYFVHFHYGARTPLRLAEGRVFEDVFETVLGAEVAERLGYKAGDRITLSHGMGHGVMAGHDDKPFVVRGILARTGTPVDRSVHVSLEAIEALHLDWQGGARLPGMSIAAEYVQRFDLSPKSVTAVLVGLHNRAAVFNLQRQVAQYRDEPLLAVLPGVALDELWRNVGTGEKALLLVSAMVVAVGLAGLIAVILTGLDQRRRELAILRSVGAHPLEIYALLALEGLLVTLGGMLLGMLLLAGLVGGLGSQLAVQYGIILPWHPSSSAEWRLLGWVILAGFSASLVPGYRAYRLSLSDGLTPRV